MGHYASEMMCNTCGQCRCACPPKPDTTLSQWVVDENFSAVLALEFDKQHDFYTMGGLKVPSPGRGRSIRAGMQHFDTEDLARVHAIKLLDEAIASSESRTAALRSRLQALAGPRE